MVAERPPKGNVDAILQLARDESRRLRDEVENSNTMMASLPLGDLKEAYIVGVRDRVGFEDLIRCALAVAGMTSEELDDLDRIAWQQQDERRERRREQLGLLGQFVAGGR